FGQLEAREEISCIKFYVADVLLKVLDRAIQTHGAMGLTPETPLAAFWAAERGARIYDGPDEVHKIVVARQILKKHGLQLSTQRPAIWLNLLPHSGMSSTTPPK